VAYSTTDQECLNTLQARTLEPQNGGTSILSTQWSLADFINSLNQAQNEWLRDSGLVVTHLGYESPSVNTGIQAAAGQEVVSLPQTLIDILRVAWIGVDTSNPPVPNSIYDLPRDDAWSLDNMRKYWETTENDPPYEYTESVAPVEQIYLANPPADVGYIDLLFVGIGAVLSNTGVPLTVPDIGVQGVQWRALELLLAKIGEAEDSPRAQHCHQRYLENVAMSKAMIGMPYRIAAEG